MNKRGNLDTPLIAVGLFMIAIAIWAAFLIVSTGQTALSGFSLSSNLLSNSSTMFLRIGGTSFAFITLGLIMFNVIGAALLTTHPIFVLVDLLFMPITLIISAQLSNAYEASFYTIPSIATNFPIMNFVMLHLPVFMLVCDILAAIVGYALTKDRQYTG